MTNLTEQWKKGELSAGRYWVKYRSGRIDEWDLLGGKTIETKPEIVEVLVPVPSYEQWKMVYKTEFELLEQVVNLKELLKDCREILYVEEMVAGNPRYIDELRILIKRINQVLGEI